MKVARCKLWVIPQMMARKTPPVQRESRHQVKEGQRVIEIGQVLNQGQEQSWRADLRKI